MVACITQKIYQATIFYWLLNNVTIKKVWKNTKYSD